jgi:predicted RNA methylase
VKQLLLTTQPGWAFAIEAELRRRHLRTRGEAWHRDSTLVVESETLPPDLRTPAEVCGVIASAHARGVDDAAQALRLQIATSRLQQKLLGWAADAPRSGLRRYSLSCETWGRISLKRSELAEVLRQALRRELPRWKETSDGGLRLVCKADPEFAAAGLRLYANLDRTGIRAGALRRHLAASLLILAGVEDGDTIFDPFVGAGTILQEAAKVYRGLHCIGVDIDAEAVELARAAVGGHGSVIAESFTSLNLERLPSKLRLVSNLPFGARFERVPRPALTHFLSELRGRLEGVALLTARDQALDAARSLGVGMRNVLVLGQPAAIVSSAIVPRRYGRSVSA